MLFSEGQVSHGAPGSKTEEAIAHTCNFTLYHALACKNSFIKNSDGYENYYSNFILQSRRIALRMAKEKGYAYING